MKCPYCDKEFEYPRYDECKDAEHCFTAFRNGYRLRISNLLVMDAYHSKVAGLSRVSFHNGNSTNVKAFKETPFIPIEEIGPYIEKYKKIRAFL